MKIFNKLDRWSTKVNFVDENNVLVGYDLTQSCCEHADWFISDTLHDGGRIPDPLPQVGEDDLAGWKFDPGFKKDIDVPDLDAGSMVAFRLVKRKNGREQKFLHLFNCHNGYYSHGFTFEVPGAPKVEGYL